MTNGEILGHKLYEIRKLHGLSQENLAQRLGVSRQAISKWECGESLPDTDNLITISKIFGISLDELVGNIQDITENDSEEIKNDDNTHHTQEKSKHDKKTVGKKKIFLKALYAVPYPVLVAAIFLFWGFTWGGWHIAWTLFITIPLYYSVIDCIKTRKLSPFAYPVFATFIYLFIGMKWGLWHPWWIIYITIPIYYAIADAIDRD